MTRYIGLDAHAKSCTLAVLGPSGKHLRTDVVETSGQVLVEYVKLIPRPRQLIMEEGTQSAWLYEVLNPHVDELVVTAIGAESSRGQKSDAKDALALAERLRLGKVERVVYKEVGPYGTLRELGRVHTKMVADHVRVINRLKSLFRSRGIAIRKATLSDAEARSDWIGRLPERMHGAAEVMFAEGDALGELRKQTEKALTEEAKKHTLSRILRTCPGMGPIRVALLLGVVVSPHRFRSRRQFWAYCGLGIVTRSSSDWVQDKGGKWARAKVPLSRGLNWNHNPTLKWLFKGAATTVVTSLPEARMHADYQRMLAAGTKPNLAKLTLSRKIAATVLSMWKNKEAYDSTKPRSQNP